MCVYVFYLSYLSLCYILACFKSTLTEPRHGQLCSLALNSTGIRNPTTTTAACCCIRMRYDAVLLIKKVVTILHLFKFYTITQHSIKEKDLFPLSVNILLTKMYKRKRYLRYTNEITIIYESTIVENFATYFIEKK